MADEKPEYAVHVDKKGERGGFRIAIKRRGADRNIIETNFNFYDGRWITSGGYSHPQEDEKFFEWSKQHSPEKRGRHSWEELSTHLSKWHKKYGGHIEFLGYEFFEIPNKFPKGFMHPRYADMKPILATPKVLFEIKRYYQKPVLLRAKEKITQREIEIARRLWRPRR